MTDATIQINVIQTFTQINVAAPPGAQGDSGWSPVLASGADGARQVLQVIDWEGGEGTKPTAGLYVGASGLVVNITDGVDVRGAVTQDFACQIEDRPSSNEVIPLAGIGAPMNFSNVNSYCKALVGATVDTTITIKRFDGTTVATAFFAGGNSTGPQVGVLTLSQTAFVNGDVLYALCPGTPDATLANIWIVFTGA